MRSAAATHVRRAKRSEAEPPPRRDQSDSSRERLLDAAEYLFAESGYGGISVRDIASHADVNLGSIPYYFGTKENLLKETLLRRILPLQQERRERLNQIIKVQAKPKIEDLLYAFLEPVFRESRRHNTFRRLAGRIATDATPEVRKVMDEIYDVNTLLAPKAMRAACPHLSAEEFNWRLMCVYGAMFYVQADTGRMQAIAGAGFDTSKPDTALKFIVPFLAAGLQAPPHGKKRASAVRKRRS